MTDVHTKKQRSYNMSQIKRRDTKPELALKNFFENKGFIYQPYEYGKPDFINYKNKIVIFIDGCFWHKCSEHFKLPSTNSGFWKKKINGNLRRDKEINLNYKNAKWNVIRIWEHNFKTGRFINNKFLNIL